MKITADHLKIAGGACAAVVVCFLIYVAVKPYEYKATAITKHWTRDVYIEQWTTYDFESYYRRSHVEGRKPVKGKGEIAPVVFLETYEDCEWVDGPTDISPGPKTGPARYECDTIYIHRSKRWENVHHLQEVGTGPILMPVERNLPNHQRARYQLHYQVLFDVEHHDEDLEVGGNDYANVKEGDEVVIIKQLGRLTHIKGVQQ